MNFFIHLSWTEFKLYSTFYIIRNSFKNQIFGQVRLHTYIGVSRKHCPQMYWYTVGATLVLFDEIVSPDLHGTQSENAPRYGSNSSEI